MTLSANTVMTLDCKDEGADSGEGQPLTAIKFGQKYSLTIAEHKVLKKTKHEKFFPGLALWCSPFRVNEAANRC